MKIRKMFIALSMVCCFSIQANNTFGDLHNESYDLLSMQEMRFCYISFVQYNGENSSGVNEFLVKQKKPVNKLLGVVRDAVTAHIAESLGADIAHKVEIIPAGEFPGKFRADWPATIHTIAPGKTVKEQNSRFDGMNIKQANIGFRRDMLSWMAMHPALPKMVGLDTFTCNHDRHRKNLFYDKKNDSFCAIDMDSAYKYNLCALSLKNLQDMTAPGNKPFTKTEMRVLTQYRDTLVFLVNRFTPDKVIQKYDECAAQAGFVPGSSLYTPRAANNIMHNKAIIEQSYQDVKKLIRLLNHIIENYTEKSL